MLQLVKENTNFRKEVSQNILDDKIGFQKYKVSVMAVKNMAVKMLISSKLRNQDISQTIGTKISDIHAP